MAAEGGFQKGYDASKIRCNVPACQQVSKYVYVTYITCSKNPFFGFKKEHNYYYLYADPWWWVNCCSVFYISLLTREKKKHCVQQYLIVSQSVVQIVAAFVLSWQQCLQHDTNCALTDFLCHYQPRRALPPVLCDPKMIATIVIFWGKKIVTQY